MKTCCAAAAAGGKGGAIVLCDRLYQRLLQTMRPEPQPIDSALLGGDHPPSAAAQDQIVDFDIVSKTPLTRHTHMGSALTLKDAFLRSTLGSQYDQLLVDDDYW